ncbi:hypothetical protein ADL21_37930 [Streptomyces albus subsp. albus]|nr:hypothetical protein ADL21_37930 [Streptomyces albus subsp. albus]
MRHRYGAPDQAGGVLEQNLRGFQPVVKGTASALGGLAGPEVLLGPFHGRREACGAAAVRPGQGIRRFTQFRLQFCQPPVRHTLVGGTRRILR